MRLHALRLALFAGLASLAPTCGSSTGGGLSSGGTVPGTGGGNVGPGYSNPADAGVVFLSDRNIDEIFEGNSADLPGTSIVNLTGPLAGQGDVTDVLWSPDRTRVAFSADKDSDGVSEVYLASVTGGAVKASPALAPGEQAFALAWAPDSSRLALLVTTSVAGTLYTVPAGGGAPVAVSPSLATPLRVSWSPDSSGIAIIENTGSTGRAYLASPTALNATFLGFGRPGPPPAWSPDSAHVAFPKSLGGDRSQLAILHVATATESLTPLPATGRRGPLNFAWSPDSQFVAYTAEMTVADAVELFTTTPDGSSITTLGGVATAGREVTAFAWNPPSTRVAYIADQDADDVFELYSSLPAEVMGSVDNLKCSGTLPAGGDVQSFRWAPGLGATTLAFLADLTTDGVAELHVAPGNVAGTPIRRSGTLVAGGNVQDFFWSPIGGALGYLADQDVDGTPELFVADPVSSQPAVKVSVGAVAADPRPAWSSDSSTLGFVSSLTGPAELYVVVPGTPPVKLSGTPVAGGNVTAFEIR